MIDGVLQLELPHNGASTAPAGTLPSFVVGPENSLLVPPLERLLHGDDFAAIATLFNPLVLVGPAGSGKSQLVQGAVRHWRRQIDPSQVEYFTAADFGRQLQDAVAEQRLESWRTALRKLRLIAIDDLHRLRPNATIQQELRCTIDEILDQGGVVIVAATREPASLNQLDLGLRDRLAAGLTLRLQRPGLAARESILQLAARTRGILATDEELKQLARREAATPAELIGRVTARRLVPGGSPPPGPTEENADPSGVALKQIIAVTARYLGLTQSAIASSSRRAALVQARNIVVHLARRLTKLSYAEIGAGLGQRDHTTTMHADRRAAEQLAQDPVLQQTVDELDRLLR